MTFAQFVDDIDGRELTLQVVNRTELDPVYGMLEDRFAGQEIVVEEIDDDTAPENEVLLCEAGEALAVSSLTEVRDSVLTVNSDLYITGSRPLEDVDTPDVIAGLGETTFSVEDHQKYLLIQLSREIEAMALQAGEGVLHSGFQELSRLDDERGTLAAYGTLGDADLDVHVYGIPDADPLDHPGSTLYTWRRSARGSPTTRPTTWKPSRSCSTRTRAASSGRHSARGSTSCASRGRSSSTSQARSRSTRRRASPT